MTFRRYCPGISFHPDDRFPLQARHCPLSLVDIMDAMGLGATEGWENKTRQEHTSRLTSSSSFAGPDLGFDSFVVDPLALVSKLSKLLLPPSLVGVETILAVSGLITPVGGGTPATCPFVALVPVLVLGPADQYPTPGFRERSINCTDDWIFLISSRRVLLVCRSWVVRVRNSSNWVFRAVIWDWRLVISSRAER